MKEIIYKLEMIAKRFRALLDKVTSKEFQQKINDGLENFTININNLNKSHPDRMEAANKLAEKGWFVTDISDIETLFAFLDSVSPYIKNLDYKKMDIESSNFINENLKTVVDSILSNNINRKQLILDAIEAHNLGLYSLSTLAFISQADGVAKDNFGFHLFSGFDFKEFDKILKKSSGDKELFKEYGFDFMLCGYIFQDNKHPKTYIEPFMSEKYRSLITNFSGFNRHQILHGEIVNFGTEINSLKSLSLLSIIDSIAAAYKNAQKYCIGD